MFFANVQKKTTKLFFALAIALPLFAPTFAHAANFYIVGTPVSARVGDSFTARVAISSPDQSMNAVLGSLSYPADLLSVTGISTASSVIGQWLPPGSTGPTASGGVVRFEGVSIAGYQGAGARIFSVTFKVKQAGTANLIFSGDQILANDGSGTNITESSRGASVKLMAAEKPTVTPAPEETPIVEETPQPAPASPTYITISDPNLIAQLSYLSTVIIWSLIGNAILAMTIIILLILLIRAQPQSKIIAAKKKTRLKKQIDAMIDSA